MHLAAIALMAAIASVTSGAPTAEPRQFEAQLHFFGAGGASYTISAPTTANSVFTTGKTQLSSAVAFRIPRILTDRCIGESLAVDKIASDGGATCQLFGVDGGSFTVVGAQTVTVGPPQAIVSGSCLAF